MNKKKLHPDRSLDYFRAERKVLALITVSGLSTIWVSWQDHGLREKWRAA